MRLNFLPLSLSPLLLSLTCAQVLTTTTTSSTILSTPAPSSSSSSSSGGSTSICAAQPVLEACLSSTTAIALGCDASDYNCLCQKYSVVLTCYEQCPNDARQPGALAAKETYCNDAAADPTGTTSAVVVATGTLVTSTTTGGSHAATSSAVGTGTGMRSGSGFTTGTGSAAGATATNFAAGKRSTSVSMMGVVAAIAAGVIFF